MNGYNFKSNLEINKRVNIGIINFEINRANFDHYKRTYQRIQSLIAEVMSTVNLLFTIGAQFSIILFDKKMYKSIISSALYKNKNEILYEHNNSMNKLQDIKNKQLTNNITNIENKLSDKSNNEFNPNKKNKKINNFDKKILKQLNYCIS